MNIVELKEKDYDRWDLFCLNSDQASFWHTTDAMQYNKNYSKEIKKIDFSFYVEYKNEIIAICPIFLEYHDKAVKLIAGGTGLPETMPSIKNNFSNENELMNLIFSHIDDISFSNKVDVCIMKIPPLVSIKNLKYNFLLEYGFLDYSFITNIIDLEQSKKIRKSYKSIINKSNKMFKCLIVSQENYDNELALIYPELHFAAARRRTRSIESFLNNIDWIKKDQACLFYAQYENKIIGFIFITCYKNCSYYFSSAILPEFNHLPVGHFLQSEVLKWLKKKNMKHYEIGLQHYSNQLNDLSSKKERNISFFKRGFGGDNYPFFGGEKYYNKEYFLETYIDRINKVNESFEI